MLCGETLSPGVCPALRLFVAFAELPQASKWRKWPLRNFRKRQNGKNGPCGTSASIKMGKMAFAELPQASKWGKWPLRNFRKHQNGENGLCGTSASIKMEEMALAELPQASKWGKWPLRNFRKRQKVLRGTCGTPANTQKFFVTLAGFPQTLTLFLRAWRGMVQRKRPGTGGLCPTGTRPNLLADPTYSVGMSRLTFFEPTRA